MTCELCAAPGHDIVGEAILCDSCLAIVVSAWRVRFRSFKETTKGYDADQLLLKFLQVMVEDLIAQRAAAMETN